MMKRKMQRRRGGRHGQDWYNNKTKKQLFRIGKQKKQKRGGGTVHRQGIYASHNITKIGALGERKTPNAKLRRQRRPMHRGARLAVANGSRSIRCSYLLRSSPRLACPLEGCRTASERRSVGHLSCLSYGSALLCLYFLSPMMPSSFFRTSAKVVRVCSASAPSAYAPSGCSQS